MEDKYWLVGIVVTILALLLFYISVRLIALPYLSFLFEKKTVKEAVRYSLEKTRKQLLVFILGTCFGLSSKPTYFHSSVDSNLGKSGTDGWFDP